MPDDKQAADVADFNAVTRAARALIEPEIRRRMAEWATLHGDVASGGSPSMLRAISEALGRCCAEVLPDGFPPRDALDLIMASVYAQA